MSFRIHCTACGKPLQVKDELAGKRVRCPGCKRIQTAMAPPAQARMETPVAEVSDPPKVQLPAAPSPSIEGPREHTPLHVAASNCDASEARAFIAKDPRLVHVRDLEGNTPLRLTVSVEVATELLRAGADVNTANDDGLTPLHKAAHCYNAALATLYLERGANVGPQNKKGITPLISAAMGGNEYQMALLLHNGADPCHTDLRGISPISESQGAMMRDVCLLLGALRKAATESCDDGVKAAASEYQSKALELLFTSMLKPLRPPGDVVLSPSGRGVLEQWKQDVSARCRELRAAIPGFMRQLTTDAPALGQAVERTRQALDGQHGEKNSLLQGLMNPRAQANLRAFLEQLNQPIVPSNPSASPGECIGTVVQEYGGAIYGDAESYKQDCYYGRVSRGAELLLVDPATTQNQFGLEIVKVKVLKNEWRDEVGKIGWVNLSITNFRKEGSRVEGLK